jgi:FkbM family methyltransferase
MLRALDVNLVLDVGGHYGEYAALLRSLGYRGEIVSFEPVAETYARLERARRHDRAWRGMHMALGAKGAAAAINVAHATDLSSFLRPSAGAAALLGTTVGRTVRTETVRIERLDDIAGPLLAAVASPRVFLKLDTQGYDAAVLEGAPQTLAHVVGLQAEVSVRPLYEGLAPFPDNLRDLMALGFELTDMHAVARENGLAVIEFDCVLRRPELGA